MSEVEQMHAAELQIKKILDGVENEQQFEIDAPKVCPTCKRPL